MWAAEPVVNYDANMPRTISTSAGSTTSFRLTWRQPNGTWPPIHRPFFLDVAILSRMRSLQVLRSNCVSDSIMLRISQPMDYVVLNCWVTETMWTFSDSSNPMI